MIRGPPKYKKQPAAKKARFSKAQTAAAGQAVATRKYGAGVLKVPYNRTFRKNAFPPKYEVTLRYADQANITLSGLSTGNGQWLFSCNGLFDPNITGTGHQPMYFDQLMAIYDHYTVVRSRITVQFAYQTSTLSTVNPIQVALFIDDDTTPGTTSNINTATERGDASTGMALTTQGVFTKLYKTWNAVTFFGKNPLANDNLQGTSSTNPSEQSYYVIQAQDLSGAEGTVQVKVLIEYDTVFDELTSISAS